MENRITPQLPAHAYKTYQIVAPPATHYRPAACEECGCGAYEKGWRTTVDERTELGAAQAHYVRRESQKRFHEARGEDGLTVFTFEAGQRCFATHQVRLDKPPVYLVREGDWRGNPRATAPRRHAGPADWLEDFQDHQDKLNQAIEKG